MYCRLYCQLSRPHPSKVVAASPTQHPGPLLTLSVRLTHWQYCATPSSPLAGSNFNRRPVAACHPTSCQAMTHSWYEPHHSPLQAGAQTSHIIRQTKESAKRHHQHSAMVQHTKSSALWQSPHTTRSAALYDAIIECRANLRMHTLRLMLQQHNTITPYNTLSATQ